MGKTETPVEMLVFQITVCRIPGKARLNGFSVRSGQSTTLTCTDAKCFARPSCSTRKDESLFNTKLL